MGAYYRTVETTEGTSGATRSLEEADQWSIFGQVYWDISDTLQATFGLRYSEQDSKVTDLLNQPVLGPDAVGKGSFTDLSPKFALDYQIDDNTMVYGSIAKGFRAGSANVDLSLGTDPNYSRDFDADTIWNYEIGTKTSFLDNRITVNAALFYIDWTDIQIDRPISDLTAGTPDAITFIVKNGDDAHSFGVEADVNITPAEGWSIVLGGSYVEAEYDNGFIDSDYGQFELKGMRLPSSPKFVANASVEKEFPIGTGGMVGFVRADYSLRGASFADVPNEAPGTDFEGDDMTLIHLRAGVRSDRWDAQVYVRNLTDEDASSFDFKLPGTLLFSARVPPKSVGVSFRLRFGGGL